MNFHIARQLSPMPKTWSKFENIIYLFLIHGDLEVADFKFYVFQKEIGRPNMADFILENSVMSAKNSIQWFFSTRVSNLIRRTKIEIKQ